MKTKFYRLCRLLFIFSVTLLIITGETKAQQSRFEYGFTYGPSNFLGDLGGNAGKGATFLKDLTPSLTHFMTGFNVAYRPFEFINIRVSVNTGKVEGADSLIKGAGGYEEARKARNQHFRSNLNEAFLAAEIYPTAFFEYEPGDVMHKIRPYAILGIGVFNFNPQAQYVNPDGSKTWVDLKPLRTEGQGMPQFPDRKEYKLTQMNIPYGVGVKYFLNQNIALSFEIINRKTFTDYIDDVSTNYISNDDFYAFFGEGSKEADVAIQMANKTAFANGGNYRPGYGIGSKRGTPTNNDAYFASTMKISIRLGKDEQYLNSRRGGDVKCPIVRF
ncbi:MAG: DUF6089 family protein [Chitinophagia bacterium]|jgi:hypothetical protein